MAPRITWKLGRVIELLYSRDKQVRSVRLKTANGVLTRHLCKLYPIEVDSNFEMPSVANDSIRPKRQAAILAARRCRDQI